MSGLAKSPAWNWSELCRHGEDMHSWEGNDFGHCFEQVAILTPAHAILAVVSVYHLGRRQVSWNGIHLHVGWTWFLVLRLLSTLVLLLSPLLQVIFLVTLEQLLPSIADGVTAGVSFLSWFLHVIYIWNLRYLHENSLRGPLSAAVAFTVVLASCAIHMHTVIIRHLAHSFYRVVSEEYATYVNASASIIYLFSLIPNRPRAYQTQLSHPINESEEEQRPLTWESIRSYNSSTLQHQDNLLYAEKDVGIISWLTFHWVQPLMYRGSKLKISSVSDLYLLPSRLNTVSVDDKFKQVLQALQQKNERQSLTNACGTSTTGNKYPNCGAGVPPTSPYAAQEITEGHINHCDSSDEIRQGHESYQNQISSSALYDRHNDQSCLEASAKKSQIKKVTLLAALNKAYGVEYYSLGILKLLADSLGFAGPVLLNYLVSFVENKGEDPYEGYYYAMGLFLTTFIGTVCSTQFDYNVQVLAFKMRCALITTIYRKSLLITAAVHSKFTSGEIVNFMSTDTDRILNFCPSFHAFWSLPFQITVSLVLLYQQVGLAFLAGVVFALILIPINRWIAVKIGQLSTEMMAFKDERVKITNELLHGIKVVKLYSWESNFTDHINAVRAKELKCLKGRKYLDAMCVFFWATAPVLMSILTFTTYVLMGNQLTAAKVFTSLSLFLMLISPLNSFPWVINGLVEAWVSLKRVQSFVCLEDNKLEQYYCINQDSAERLIKIKDGSFSWMSPTLEERSSEPVTETSSNYTSIEGNNYQQIKTQDLQGINLNVFQGQFVGIAGKVGSGKSSLLSAIIGELRKIQGKITVSNLDEGFAYVAQEPWIQHATVRDNILFGRLYNSKQYEMVLEACALIEDLKMLPAGDMTEIGENGLTLSGGQKARVSLARAVYQDKDIYLLDDPLSAVDAHVAKHIYTHCIMGLLKKKTRVLCTHHVKFLKKADLVILMEDGCIAKSGSPSEVLLDINFNEELKNKAEESENKEAETAQNTTDEYTLVEEEERETGVVKGAVYKAYWKAVGSCLSPLVLVSLLLMQASKNSGDWFLSYWVTNSAEKEIPGDKNMTHTISQWTEHIPTSPWRNLNTSDDNLVFYLGIYAGLTGANVLSTLLRSFLFAYGGLCAAKVMHKKLLHAILKAPMSFFNSTPIGRIVNRFSSDLYSVDDSLPFTLNIFLAQAFGILGTLVLTCYGLPWFAICLIPMTALYYKIQLYYRHTSRELKRLSSVTLSPIYAHFSETITGLSTIRAMRHSQRFCEENKQRLDTNQRAQYATQLSSCWLNFRLRLLGVAMVTCLSLIAVLQHHLTAVNAGLVGLALSYSLSVTNLLGQVVLFFTATEKEFVSVERCQHYINETPSEKWTGTLFPPSLWPSLGAIVFDDVWLKYKDNLNPVLKGVSFRTEPGEKVGIVGRTGAGKSSLFLALFRLVEICDGCITVDGVDLKYLDLHDIRSKLAIIPQDPFLFSGTVRRNLDPLSAHSDTDLWSAIDRCHMRECVDRMGGLKAVITQNGREFSVGQRQLLCLARAILTQAKVLCIDEATANVDMETDTLIQNTIRTEFKDSTVLTIAHRIHTVLDSHRVLVLKDGAVAEFSAPGALLQDSHSLFYSLVYGSS